MHPNIEVECALSGHGPGHEAGSPRFSGHGGSVSTPLLSLSGYSSSILISPSTLLAIRYHFVYLTSPLAGLSPNRTVGVQNARVVRSPVWPPPSLVERLESRDTVSTKVGLRCHHCQYMSL
jgi:hypothetical protein